MSALECVRVFNQLYRPDQPYLRLFDDAVPIWRHACHWDCWKQDLDLMLARNQAHSLAVQVPNPNEPVKGEEKRDVVEFKGPVDSVYLKAKDYVELDVGTGAAVAISSSGWEDVVVVSIPP